MRKRRGTFLIRFSEPVGRAHNHLWDLGVRAVRSSSIQLLPKLHPRVSRCGCGRHRLKRRASSGLDAVSHVGDVQILESSES